MLIALDTNLLFDDPLWAGRRLTELAQMIARIDDATLVLPQAVVVERTRQLRSKVTEELARTSAANTFWRALGRPELVAPEVEATGTVDAVVERMARRLEELGVQVLAAPLDLDHLIGRAKRGGRPFTRPPEPVGKGKDAFVRGMGDALIWNELLAALRDDEVVLVTTNWKDFGDPETFDDERGTAEPYKDMADECEALGIGNTLVVVSSLAHLRRFLIDRGFLQEEGALDELREDIEDDADLKDRLREALRAELERAAGGNPDGAEVDWPHVGPAELVGDPEPMHVALDVDALEWSVPYRIDPDIYAVDVEGRADLSASLWAHTYSLWPAFHDEFPSEVSFESYDEDDRVVQGEWYGSARFEASVMFRDRSEGLAAEDRLEVSLQLLEDDNPAPDPAIRDLHGNPIEIDEPT